MQTSAAPKKFAVPFANAAGPAFIRDIPTDSQVGATPGAASLADGFPPLTFIDKAVGGIPPNGQDFNGILYWLSAAMRWLQSRPIDTFDQAFANAIGGYPAGAIVQSADGAHLWRNSVENNATHPELPGSANWTVYSQAVTSVFGRTGSIGAQNGDYSAEQITSAVSINAFTGGNQSFGGNGWQRLPGGLIFQWVTARISGPSSTFVVWPITFPNAVMGAVVSANGDLPGTPPSVTAVSQTGVTIDCASGGDTPRSFVIALGF